MNELELKIKPEGGLQELIVRHGDALPLREPKVISLSGVITSPADYYEKKKKNIEPLDCNVVANYTSRRITLTLSEQSYYAGTITGSLEIHPDLKKLEVNGTKYYTEKELYKTLNFQGRYFQNKEVYTDLIEKLKKFKASVQQEFVNQDSLKGAAAISKLTNITTDIPLNFILAMPVFSGFDPKTFEVSINVTAQDGEVKFYMERIALNDIISTETESIFEKQIARLKDFVIIKQW